MKVHKRSSKRGPSWTFTFKHRGRKIRKGGFPTKALAEDAGTALRRRLREEQIETTYGITIPRGRFNIPTLATYIADVYEPMILSRSAPSSHAVRRSRHKRLTEQIGSVRLCDISPSVMDDKLVGPRLREVGTSQIRNEVRALNAIINHALRGKVITSHPFRGRWKWPRLVERDYNVVTVEMETAVRKEAPEEFRDWVVVALYTGMRKGELVALSPKAVDMVRQEFRLVQGKTGRVKTIPMSDEVRDIVSARLHRPHAQLMARPQDGKTRGVGWINQHWQRTRKAAGLPVVVRFHDLRHTFASRLAEHESVATVGELLGHKPPYRVTLRYFHVLGDAKRRAIERLARDAKRVTADSEQNSPTEKKHSDGR